MTKTKVLSGLKAAEFEPLGYIALSQAPGIVGAP